MIFIRCDNVILVFRDKMKSEICLKIVRDGRKQMGVLDESRSDVSW